MNWERYQKRIAEFFRRVKGARVEEDVVCRWSTWRCRSEVVSAHAQPDGAYTGAYANRQTIQFADDTEVLP